MLFSSMEFLFVFLPIVITVNCLLPSSIRNYWLLASSLFFYAWGEPKFVLVMLLSIVLNYTIALFIQWKRENRILCKMLLAISILINIGILFVYKYMNFVVENMRRCFPNSGIIQTEFVLPIGISFFTFQALSYVIDVYRNTGNAESSERGVEAQKNPFHLALYISLFPQLIAGPIVRYSTIAGQIKERHIDLKNFSEGLMRFVLGFNKKMLLANLLAEISDYAFSSNHLSMCMAWLGAICYALQIYFDFSGYSDMAIGLGRVFGFKFLENFNYPYISKTLTEFWRRWHISLGSWFRDYLYFPLGGSRVSSKGRLIFNLFVVWLATGIWHGASWHFIIWGILHGFVVVAEKLLNIPQKIKENVWWKIPYQIFVLVVIIFAWVLFRADNLSIAATYFKALFGWGDAGFIDYDFWLYGKSNMLIIAVALISSIPIIPFINKKLQHASSVIRLGYYFLEQFVQVVLFLVGISFLVINAHNPFIYFNF